MLNRIVDESSWGKYDFMYLRIDFANDCKWVYSGTKYGALTYLTTRQCRLCFHKLCRCKSYLSLGLPKSLADERVASRHYRRKPNEESAAVEH